MIRAVGKLTLALWLAAAVVASGAQALTPQPVGAGFEEPIYVTSAPNDPDRLFVVERKGAIAVVEDGAVRPFANIESEVLCCTGETGLLSIAPAPDFGQSGRLFLFYTGEDEPGEIHIAEMVAGAGGGSAPLSSLRNLLTIPHPTHRNHYGGQLQFGPDRALYASTGDGGGSDDVEKNAQNPSKLLGKILRFPVPGVPTVSVWSLGLRNPFRFSFDRLTGALTIGDVGEKAREEVDYVGAPSFGAGANFGWNCREGLAPGPATDPECAMLPPGSFTEPIFDYVNGPNPGDPCAIIGGYVARGPGYGDLYGRYVYGDFCTGTIRSLLPTTPFAIGDRSEGVNVANLNSFGEDSCGRLYAVSGNGPVYRLVGPGAGSCEPSSPPEPALSPSFVGIRAISRRVKRNKRALITAWVSPCQGRKGDPVTLWRGRRKMGTRRLDRVCSARFRPRISRRSGFRATVKADDTYVAAISRRLTVRPVRRHR